jgi:hypothetical protein
VWDKGHVATSLGFKSFMKKEFFTSVQPKQVMGIACDKHQNMLGHSTRGIIACHSQAFPL